MISSIAARVLNLVLLMVSNKLHQSYQIPIHNNSNCAKFQYHEVQVKR